jgi:general secretion pathway protein E
MLSAAQVQGMISMREDGERLVAQGITSAQELLRVTRD